MIYSIMQDIIQNPFSDSLSSLLAPVVGESGGAIWYQDDWSNNTGANQSLLLSVPEIDNSLLGLVATLEPAQVIVDNYSTYGDVVSGTSLYNGEAVQMDTFSGAKTVQIQHAMLNLTNSWSGQTYIGINAAYPVAGDNPHIHGRNFGGGSPAGRRVLSIYEDFTQRASQSNIDTTPYVTSKLSLTYDGVDTYTLSIDVDTLGTTIETITWVDTDPVSYGNNVYVRTVGNYAGSSGYGGFMKGPFTILEGVVTL